MDHMYGYFILFVIRSMFFFFFSSRRRHTRLQGDWSSDVCSSDLPDFVTALTAPPECWPYWAGTELVSTLNSCRASGKGSGKLKLVYGSLCDAPSNRYVRPLFNPPATEMISVGYPRFVPNVPPPTALPETTINCCTLRALSGNSTTRTLSITWP